MKDITPFLSKLTSKEVLTHVYVKDGYAVATDSFRLVEIKLEENFCVDNIKNGYYTAQKWKELCKAHKKKDLYAIVKLVQENELYKDVTKDFQYPEYKGLIPKAETLTDFNPDIRLNFDYLVDFMKMMITLDKIVDFSKIKTNGNMIYFENDEMKVMLMKLNI